VAIDGVFYIKSWESLDESKVNWSVCYTYIKTCGLELTFHPQQSYTPEIFQLSKKHKSILWEQHFSS